MNRKKLKIVSCVECIILICLGSYYLNSLYKDDTNKSSDIDTVLNDIDYQPDYFRLSKFNQLSKLNNILDKSKLDIDIEKGLDINTDTSVEEIQIESTIEQPTRSNDELADEVIKGLWGNGAERREKLISAGYDYDAIQQIVDEKMPKSIAKSNSNYNYTQNNQQNNLPTQTNTTNNTSSNSSYLGCFRITGYYSGEGSVGSVSASGMRLVPWGTCAMNNTRRKELGIK